MTCADLQVTDFGLSRMGPSGDSSLDAQLLNSSASLSVPVRWTPPEVLTQGSWSEKSDVWSFGVTVWEIFSDGAEPYARKSDEEVRAGRLPYMTVHVHVTLTAVGSSRTAKGMMSGHEIVRCLIALRVHQQLKMPCSAAATIVTRARCPVLHIYVVAPTAVVMSCSTRN